MALTAVNNLPAHDERCEGAVELIRAIDARLSKTFDDLHQGKRYWS